jgi:hypothetical protein
MNSWPYLVLVRNAPPEVDVKGVPGPRRAPPRVSSLGRTWSNAVIVVAVVAGIVLRVWFLFHDPVTSDEAVVGLFAREILHGHTNAFVSTQTVGGVEPYVVAGFFFVFGQGTFALLAAPVALSVVSALLVWRVALRLVQDRQVAALAGALAWAAPLPAVYLSTVEGGYRGVTLVCGLAALVFALRILDGRRGYPEWIGLGLAAGVGWWALPEVVYFLLPAGLLVVAALVGVRSQWAPAQWVPRLGAGLGAVVIGALPWIWANVGSGFASLNAHSFSGSTSPSNPGFGGRLEIFFKDGLPVQLDLRRFDIGTLLFGGSGDSAVKGVLMGVLIAAVVLVVVGAIALCFLRGGRATALGLALVAYPFLVAWEPGTWFWIDGRYTVYTGSLLALVLAVASEELVRRVRPRSEDPIRVPVARVVMSVVVLASVGLTLFDFHQSFGVTPSSYAAKWGDPDGPSHATIAGLERAHVRTGYAGYWVAYKLDLLSDDHLVLTVAAPDPVRSTAIDHEVRTSADPAWLFVRPSQIPLAETQLGTLSQIQGPGGLAEHAFTAMLRRQGIPYRVVDAGMIEAVVPGRRINPNAG